MIGRVFGSMRIGRLQQDLGARINFDRDRQGHERHGMNEQRLAVPIIVTIGSMSIKPLGFLQISVERLPGD